MGLHDVCFGISVHNLSTICFLHILVVMYVCQVCMPFISLLCTTGGPIGYIVLSSEVGGAVAFNGVTLSHETTLSKKSLKNPSI